MDANAREKFINALIKCFERSVKARYSWAIRDDPTNEDIASEVGRYFGDIESRLSHLEHPLRD